MQQVQLRGNCPICGSQQAVVKGGMSKHGYTVKQGWFQGVCHGEGKPPMQVSRVVTEEMAANVRAECDRLDKVAAGLKNGKLTPKFISFTKSGFVNGRYESVELTKPFAEGDAYEQKDQVKRDIWAAESRARQGRRFAEDMLALLDKVHGKPLVEVETAAAPEPITLGEKRLSQNGKTLTARQVRGPRVYWKSDAGFQGWTGTSAWRKLNKLEA